MSPLGIKRTVAVLLILSPWIFVPGLLKDVVFIFAGIFLYMSTIDLRKKSLSHHESPEHQETENNPVREHIASA